MPDNRQTGIRYEQAAAAYLMDRGYQIIETNYAVRQGEIDLVALDPGGVLVFVEVKYRHTGSGYDPLEAVDLKKQRRIGRTAVRYLSTHPVPDDMPLRFDVIGMQEDGRVMHVKNAFEYKGR